MSVYRSRSNPKERLQLKIKLFTLVRAKRIEIDKIVKMLIFVREFVNLPPKFENEFQETQFSLTFPNQSSMTISQGTKEFASGLYERVFGYDPEAKLAEENKRNQEILTKERQRLDNAILYLYHQMNMSVLDISNIVNKDTAYIESLLISNKEENQE
jgi:hypothetical protein